MIFKPKSLEKLQQITGTSSGCGKCKLCGKYKNFSSMVNFTKEFIVNTKQIKKTFKLKHQLTCKDRGIYGAICTQPNCGEIYIGQASVSYSKRWNGHRFEWKSSLTDSTNEKTTEGLSQQLKLPSDKTALIDHYRKFHAKTLSDLSKNKINYGFDQSFSVTFIDTATQDFNQLEDSWKQKTKASINRSIIITPNII